MDGGKNNLYKNNQCIKYVANKINIMRKKQVFSLAKPDGVI